jgi:hypothetical protein
MPSAPRGYGVAAAAAAKEGAGGGGGGGGKKGKKKDDGEREREREGGEDVCAHEACAERVGCRSARACRTGDGETAAAPAAGGRG